MMNREDVIKNKNNLWRTDLSGADLWRADLWMANLTEANLSQADLPQANLSRANLSGANLSGADLSGANLPKFQIPQEGSIVVWKKLKGGVLCKMLIPHKARRTATLVGRKCRAEYVKVLELFNCSESEASDRHTGNTPYVVGEFVRPDSYDDDIRIECTNGIHFFLTREEAEEY